MPRAHRRDQFRQRNTEGTNPPLVGWFTRGTDTSIPLTVLGEARAR